MAKKKVALLLADGFEEVEAMTPIDFLRRAGIEVTVLGVDTDQPTGGHGVTVKTDGRVENPPRELDGVVIPGGMPGATNVADSEAAQALISELYEADKLIAAICAAPAMVLHPLGILDGRKATCYPGFEKELTQAEFTEERVVHSGTVITSRGPGTAAEFSAAVIEYLLDAESARKVVSATLQPFSA